MKRKKKRFDDNVVYRTALALACGDMLFDVCVSCKKCKAHRMAPRNENCDAREDTLLCGLKLMSFYSEEADEILNK